MGPKRGGVHQGTRQSSRLHGRDASPKPDEQLFPNQNQGPFEQPHLEDVVDTVCVAPTQAIDPHLQHTVELLTQALFRAGHTRDLALTYVDQTRRIGAVDFDGRGDPAVAEDWIENVEKIMEVMEVPHEQGGFGCILSS